MTTPQLVLRTLIILGLVGALAACVSSQPSEFTGMTFVLADGTKAKIKQIKRIDEEEEAKDDVGPRYHGHDYSYGRSECGRRCDYGHKPARPAADCKDGYCPYPTPKGHGCQKCHKPEPPKSDCHSCHKPKPTGCHACDRHKPSCGSCGGHIPKAITVKHGDTLYGISRKYGVPLGRLVKLNHLHCPDCIYVGQKLQLR